MRKINTCKKRRFPISQQIKTEISICFFAHFTMLLLLFVCVFIFAALVERILVDCHDIVEVVDSVELTFVDALQLNDVVEDRVLKMG